MLRDGQKKFKKKQLLMMRFWTKSTKKKYKKSIAVDEIFGTPKVQKKKYKLKKTLQ